MTHRVLFRLTAGALTLVLSMQSSGCRESRSLGGATAPNAPASITPRVVVSPDAGGLAIATIAFDVSAGVGRLGSFTGRLHFDAGGLEYVGDVALSDSTMRASNRTGDVIRVAGISTTGLDVTRLAAFRFRVMNASALSTLRFDVDEVHAISRASMLSLVRSPNAAGVP